MASTQETGQLMISLCLSGFSSFKQRLIELTALTRAQGRAGIEAEKSGDHAVTALFWPQDSIAPIIRAVDSLVLGCTLVRQELIEEKLVTELSESSEQSSIGRLADLPPSQRFHPLFRKGYNCGYSDRAYEESLAKRSDDLDQPVAHTVTSQPIFDVTTGGLRHRLVPGVRVMRDVSTLTDERFVTESPCCGRTITLVTPELEETLTAVCCHCRVLFTVGLTQEDPDGFGEESPHIAMFMVEQLDITVTQHRTGRWEQLPRNRNRLNK